MENRSDDWSTPIVSLFVIRQFFRKVAYTSGQRRFVLPFSVSYRKKGF
jgi:hypothetical protein